MKIITLNAWGGRVTEPLKEFLLQNQDVDIFCLQEIFHNAEDKEISELLSGDTKNLVRDLYQTTQGLLPTHNSFFTPVFEDYYGLAIFIKKNIVLKDNGEVLLYENRNFPDLKDPDKDHTRKMQWIRFTQNGSEYCVMNIHGHWDISGKLDTNNRILQSNRVRLFTEKLPRDIKKIMCGDFNLRPETKSMDILEEGMINLIKTNNVISTRTSLYKKEDRLADYILISPNIKPKDFKVVSNGVSDHSALFLEC